MTARLTKEQLERMRFGGNRSLECSRKFEHDRASRDLLAAVDAYEALAAEADRYREALEHEAASGAVEWGLRDETEFAGFRFKLTHHEDGGISAHLAADTKETK